MTHTMTAEPAAAPRSKTLLARMVGVLFAPRATYADVAAHPRALGALLVVLAVAGGSTFAFLSTEVGKTAMLDQQIRSLESFGIKINDAALQRMQDGAARAPYVGALGQVVVLTLAGLVIAGIAVAIFNAALGGNALFKQVFAVVVHSGVILAIGALFVLPLDYARETLSSPTTLAVFAPFLDDGSFAARLLGSIDLIRVWWFVSLAIGLGVLYRRRTGPIVVTMLSVYAAIALVIAAIQSAVSGA
jgi:hypothetical protein